MALATGYILSEALMQISLALYALGYYHLRPWPDYLTPLGRITS